MQRQARRKRDWLGGATVACALLVRAAYASGPALVIENPCSKRESVAPAGKDAAAMAMAEKYRAFLDGNLTAGRAFAEAWSLHGDWQTFGEYWMARVLLEAGLPGAAAERFDRLITQKGNDPAIHAALECFVDIQQHYPMVELSSEAVRRLPERITETPAQIAAVAWLAARLGEGKTSDGELATALLKQGGIAARYFEALKALKAGRGALALPTLRELLSMKNPPPFFARQRDALWLLLGRSYYEAGQNELAAASFERVPSRSNAWVTAQSDLAWASYRARDLSRSLGVAARLRSGPLRETFAPEPLLVAAMIHNETCAFPAARAALRRLHDTYEGPRRWLKSHLAAPVARRAALYPLAVETLRSNRSDVPKAIVLEWLHSPIFLASQDRINLSFREQDRVNDSLEVAEDEGKLPEAERRQVSAAADAFRKEAVRYAQRQQALRARLRERIEDELQRLTTRMARQLEDLEENARLVEVEVLHGAAADAVAYFVGDRHDRLASVPLRLPAEERSRVYDWGQTTINDSGAEYWPDESRWRVPVSDGCRERGAR